MPAIDPALRESAQRVAGALGDGDVKTLESLLPSGADAVTISDWYRGRAVSAEAYESTDDHDLALAQLELTCPSQHKTFWLQFRRSGETWQLVPPPDDAETHLHC